MTNTRTHTLALVGCASVKLSRPAPAAELYRSDLFRKASAYAELAADSWLILSAKHGAVRPEEVLEPYDVKLGTKAARPIHAWAKDAAAEVLAYIDELGLHHSEVTLVLLAGEQYGTLTRYLGDVLEVTRPLEGLGIGERKAWLKAQLEAAPACECAAEYLGHSAHTAGCPLDNTPAEEQLVEVPATTEVDVADPLELVAATRAKLAELEAQLVEEVLAARGAGAPWSAVGTALGVSKQAAAKRFGGVEEVATRLAIRLEAERIRNGA